MFIDRQRCVVLATTLSWWWLLSSLQLLINIIIIVPKSIAVATAVDALSSSSSSSSSSAEALQLVRSRRQRRRRAQQQQEGDNMEKEDEEINSNPTITINVVGGDVVPKTTYPYFVWATGNATAAEVCGGTLIHPDIVLTSANCSTWFAPGKVVNVAGTDETTPLNRNIEKVFVHANYIAAINYNDIMLVKLNEPTTVKPVKLSRFQWLSFPFRSVTVIGLGVTMADGTGGTSTDLHSAKLQLATRGQCKASFGSQYNPRITLCAGAGGSGGKGACVGDKGGPLLVRNVQHGITTNMTTPCGQATASSSFIRVSRYYSWIWYYACKMTAVKTKKCKE